MRLDQYILEWTFSSTNFHYFFILYALFFADCCFWQKKILMATFVVIYNKRFNYLKDTVLWTLSFTEIREFKIVCLLNTYMYDTFSLWLVEDFIRRILKRALNKNYSLLLVFLLFGIFFPRHCDWSCIHLSWNESNINLLLNIPLAF